MTEPFHRNGLRARLLSGMGANAYGQLITLMIQLLSVPLFLHAWGAERYGEWLMLAAIPSYLTLSDIGFASVAGNQMTILVARNQRESAIQVYQSGIALIILLSVTSALLLIMLIFAFELGQNLSLRFITYSSLQLVLMLLSLQVLVSLQGGMLSAGFRASGKNTLGIIANNTVRAFEWLIVVIIVLRGGGILEVAQAFLACRIIGTLASWYLLKCTVPWMRFGWRDARFSIIRALFKPALAFMAFPLGLAMVMQGSILIIGMGLGATAVTVFSAYRTLSRVMVQVMTAVSQAAWPEISAAHGSGNYYLLRRMHSKGMTFSFWIGLIAVLALGIWGELLIGYWTKNTLLHDPGLLWGLLIAAYINILWQPGWVLLMATNKHSDISIFYIFISMCFIGVLWLCISTQGLVGAGIALVVYEAVLFLYVVQKALKLISRKGKGLLF